MHVSPKRVPWPDQVGRVWKLFWAARVSLCVSLGLTVVFLVDAQCRDALRVVLENAGEEAPVDAFNHIMTLLATVGTGSLALWFWGQQPMRLLLGPEERESRPAIWLVRSAAIAPVIAIAITLARMPVDDTSLRPLRWVLVTAFVVGAGALYALFRVRREWGQLAFLRTDESYRWMAWSGGALALAVFLFSLVVREYANHFGPVGVMCLAAAFWTTLLSPLVVHGTRHNIPWLLILTGLGFALGLSNWNDNHEIRHSRATEDPLTETADVTRTSVIDGFRAWKKTHPDGPIVFVAAEGGGIYAAYHSAYLLARLHETTRHQFGRHVFMLSSVSGGSVGTGLFVSLLAADQRAPAGGMAVRFTPAVRTVLEEDLLSPLLMAAVGPDALQRLLPVSIPWFDRARGLEDALAHRWRAAENDWAAPGDKTPRVDWGTSGNIWDLWLTPDGQGIRTDLPALFINTTLVEATRIGVRNRFTGRGPNSRVGGAGKIAGPQGSVWVSPAAGHQSRVAQA